MAKPSTSDKASKASSAASAVSRTPQAVNLGGESLAERLMPHLKKIIAAFVVVGVVVAIYFGLQWRKERARVAMSEKVIAVLNVADSNIVKPDVPDPAAGSAAGSDAPAATPPAPAPEGTYPSTAARAEASLGKMTTDDMLGATFKGGLLLDAGRYDDAIAAFTKGSTAAGSEGAVAREGIGLALEAKAMAQTDAAAKQAGLEQALSAFKAMQPDATGPRRDFALYHQGRILATIGKKAEAIAAFEAAKAVEDTDLDNTIDDRLAQLEAGA